MVDLSCSLQQRCTYVHICNVYLSGHTLISEVFFQVCSQSCPVRHTSPAYAQGDRQHDPVRRMLANSQVLSVQHYHNNSILKSSKDGTEIGYTVTTMDT